MIKVIVQAGFGNQLFQYAMGYALSKRLDRELILDVSFFDYMKEKAREDAVRFNNLDKLALENPQFHNKPKTYKKYLWGARLSKITLHLSFLMRENVLWENVANCREYQRTVIDRVPKYNRVTLYGFWQHPDYFKDYISELKKQFVPNYILSQEVRELKNRIETTENSVGVHIRRGDFVRLGWAEDSDYYKKAMKLMVEKKGKCQFFLFSDDKKWVKKEFGDYSNVAIIDIKTENTDIDEFFLLSLCKNQIISESTFGWWAAFLNNNPERIIIIPEYAKGDLFPKEWIRI